MRLRYHLLILSAIAVATVIFFPLPYFIMMLVLLAEGALYAIYVIEPSQRELRHKRRRGIGR